MPRPSIIPEEKKDAARVLIRKGNLTNADIARTTGISEMTVAKLKRDLANGDEGATAPGEKQLSQKEQIQQLSNALILERLRNKYLLRYAKADETEKPEVEIKYLLERAAVFGDEDIKRLSDEEEEEEETDTETEE